jgi:hypothetical protein
MGHVPDATTARSLEEAQAELDVLKQEQAVRQLLAGGKPTAEAMAHRERLQKVVADLKAKSREAR